MSVRKAIEPDPDHNPAVRRVVAWVEAIRRAADAFQSDALHRAARKLRELADALERDPDIWGQHHALRHRDEMSASAAIGWEVIEDVDEDGRRCFIARPESDDDGSRGAVFTSKSEAVRYTLEQD